MFVDYATANFMVARLHLPEIIINSDGTVTPETGYIQRAGNVYTLTANITQEYSVQIERSNIVFDGAGHTIDVAVPGVFNVDGCKNGFYEDVGITLLDVNNVIVKNVNVSSNNIYTIYLHGSSNCQIIGVTTNKLVRISGSFNNITESNTGIAIFAGSSNLITRNNISDLLVGGPSNVFFKNNFYLTDYPSLNADNSWDNGSVGNYWSNYTTKYPNASEIGNTGTGNTPYIIEREWHSTKYYPNAKNVDNYPLMYPYDIENDAIVFPIPEPTPTPEPEPFPATFVITASGASAAIIGIGLLVYFKKRKH